MKLYLRSIVAAAALGVVALSGNAALANEYDGWTFARDSFNDGTGGEGFEIYGLAFKQEGNIFSVAFNAGTSLAGTAFRSAADGNVGWGDLFLSVGDTEYGIRFAETNDSGVSELGVYENITTKDVTAANAGWSSFESYANYVGDDASFYGDERDEAFFDNDAHRQSGNVLATGDKIADIAFLGASELLDFSAAFGGVDVGAYTFGFNFELAAGMTGDFLLHALLECINDGIALDGSFETALVGGGGEAVPEPASAIALGLVGAIAAGKTLRQRRTA